MIGTWPPPRQSHAFIIALTFSIFAVTQADACGRDTDCTIGHRHYRIILPERPNTIATTGAIIFVHGYRGTAEGVIGNQDLAALTSELGVALIAAQAAGPEWNIRNIPSADALEGVDELEYFDALAADVAERFSIERTKTLVAGFSSGAMMVWNLACYRGDAFAGFVAMSGTFWEPIPDTCPKQLTNLIHYHGKNDPVVPLRGRQIKDAHQGDVLEAIELMTRLGDYGAPEAASTEGLECTRRTDGEEHILELCLFAGEHELRPEYLARAARIFGIVGNK